MIVYNAKIKDNKPHRMVIVIDNKYLSKAAEIVFEMEKNEKELCNLPQVFSEIFKDEINANDEERIYNGVKRIIKKYSQDKEANDIISEFTRVITGGASLDEIFQVALDEALNPTLASQLTTDHNCR